MRSVTVRLIAFPAAIAALALALFSQDAKSPSSVPVRMIVTDSAADAESILDQLRTGADFAVLAAEKSTDPTSVDGGLLGRVDPATLRPELRDALKGLSPGQLSQIVRIPSGYAVLKVLTDAEAEGLAGTDRDRQSAVRAESSIVYQPYVSGMDEAFASLLQTPKDPSWGQNLKQVCAAHLQSIDVTLKRLDDLLDPANKQSPLRDKSVKPLDVINVYIAKGQLHAYRGEMALAVPAFEEAYRIALSDAPQAAPQLEQMLGISYLHKSEMDNDVYRTPGDRCLFPMRPDLRYTHPADSLKAIQFFTKYLERKPGDLGSKWLLNLAYMTVGQYPAGVPPKYFLPIAAFDSAEKVARFKDVAPQAGLNLFGMASGVVVDDFDNDGLYDVVTSSFDTCEPMHYFHNNGNGTFTDRAEQAGLSNQLGGLNLMQTDYNNDACPDILVMRGAWEQPGHRKSLLRNNCNGTFTDVTKEAGLAEPATNSQAAVWADINNDGFLDLFVGNENTPSQLWLNNGDETFRDISRPAGVDRSAFSKGVVAADYDNDGYIDFYVTNANRGNFLYHNNHNGTFTEIARQAGVEGTGRSFAAWFFDYDNDGWPDLFVNTYNISLDENLKTYFGPVFNTGTLKLYRNLGNGAFRDVTRETGLDRVFMPMGANFGDIDNDGWPDIYLGTGNPSYGSLVPNVLLRNKQGKSFVDVTASSGTGELHKGHGVAFADIDNDGDEDIITSIGGATPGDKHAFRLFENPGNGNDWIRLRLIGVKANRPAVGARIKVTVRNEGGVPRAIYRTVGSGGSFGASPLEQHIGLGKSAQILSIEIRWPDGSKTPQTLSNVSKNQTLQIRQLATDYTRVDRRPIKLGGGS